MAGGLLASTSNPALFVAYGAGNDHQQNAAKGEVDSCVRQATLGLKYG